MLAPPAAPTDAPTTDAPTWYRDIRSMFTETDIAHMSSQGLDLTSYEDVRASAGAIYGQVATQNMPPDAPWSAEEVQTFLTWMTNGFAKGTPSEPAQLLAADTTVATRIRKDLAHLNATEVDTLKKAFQGIMAKPTSDPDSYFVQAGYHWLPQPTYCQHHAPAYNPWHRAYLLSFENALRSVPGCEDVTLPYWDITAPFPDLLKEAPFDAYTLPETIGGGYNKGYVTNRFSYLQIAQNLLTYQVIEDVERAMKAPDWEDFHGFWSGATHNTIIAAHDGGHGAIGPTMSNQSVAAFDPVFWFFHCNWDRLWWEWQKSVNATGLNGLLSTIDKTTDPISYQIFTIPALQSLEPFTTTLPIGLDTIKVIDSVTSLGVDYGPAAVQPATMGFALKSGRTFEMNRGVRVDPQRVVVSVEGINRLKIPGSFKVHLMKDGKPLASRFMFQPDEAEKCETCVKNAIAHFDFDLPLSEISEGELSAEVEPVDTTLVGARFPMKMMGKPTISVHIPLQTR